MAMWLEVKKKAVYESIRLYIDENGFSPTVRELCKLTDTKSTSTIQKCIDELVKDGLLERKGKSPRTLRLAERRNDEV